jgi:hypothetical protein
VNRRRLPFVLIAIVALVGAVMAGRDEVQPVLPTFSAAATGWMPAAPAVGGVTETWFCPGVPATGIDDVGGNVIVVNRTGERKVGTLLLFNERSENYRVDLTIEAWTVSRVDLAATLPGAMVGALIEIEGGGVLVEQQSLDRNGDSSSACANATSDTWYVADGSTVDGSLDQIVLSNPYDQRVVATLEFATREGSRAPSSYRGLIVPPRSTRVIDLGAPGAGAQGEPVLAVSVQSTRGRLVVGRAQRNSGGGRSGTQVTLAVPSPRDQWWFANGHKGEGVTERYSIYNPTEEDVEVDPIFLGIPTAVQPDPIPVPAKEVVTFEPGSVVELPDGPYAVVFSTLAQPTVVIERASTVTADAQSLTTVVAGATPRPDGYLATDWYVAAAPAAATEDALVVYNGDNAEGTVTVSALGASGPVPVPGLVDVALPGPDAILTIDLTDPIVLGRPLLIESTNRVFVERSYPSGVGDLRTGGWAIPFSPT